MSVTRHEPAYREQGIHHLGVRVDDAVAQSRAANAGPTKLRIVPEPSAAGSRGRENAPTRWSVEANVARAHTFGATALAPAPVLVPVPPSAPVLVPQTPLAPVQEVVPLISVSPTAVTLAPTRPSRPVAHRIGRPRPPAAAPIATTKYRLTPRGQRAVLAAGFVLAIVIGAITGTIISHLTPAVATSVMTVQQGDSLWTIAGSVSSPGADLRPVMDEITELNGLEGSTIVAGQSLLVPIP